MESNNKAMREALESVRRDMWDLMGSSSESLCEALALRINKTIRAALAAPPRQCDVGTIEEQELRFLAFCASQEDASTGCLDCPCFAETGGHCELAWAQMPYNESEANNGEVS